MEPFFVLAGLVLLAFPILAFVAFLRTFSLRRDVDSNADLQTTAARDLRIEVATLRRMLGETQSELARVKASVAEGVAPVSSTPAATHTVSAQVAPLRVDPKPAQPQATEVAETAAAPQPCVSRTEPENVTTPPAPVTPPAAFVTPVVPVAPPAAPVTARPEPPLVAQAAAPVRPNLPPAPSRPAAAPNFAYAEPSAPRRTLLSTFASWLGENLPLEAVLGMNLFARIGIVLLVLGFALLGRMALVAMGPGGKVALIYSVGAALLGGGICLERKERYRLLGRTGIGGGWALLFFTTYALQHVAAMQVMHSATLNCVLLLAVAIATTLHTLRYESQFVSGLAFLLGFSTVALTQDTVFALSAGVILALGIVFVALKKRWYELEIFGIVASFGNHLYWLYRLYPDGVAGHAFAEFWPSTAILLLYWLVFRISYVVRRVESPREERVSTLAALADTVLLLVVMKFQSTRPELAFYALAALGLIEFAFGQLPITRRRRPAFTLLTVMGTLLVFAAVPFKYSGNSIALVWMIAAEALLVAGIVQEEVVFRRLGLIAGILTGGLVAFGARSLLELRATSEQRLVTSGTQLLLCAVLLYVNAYWLRARCKPLFAELEGALVTVESYLGALMAFLGVWAIVVGDWTAIGWAALLLLAAIGVRVLRDRHLLLQAWLVAAAVTLRAALVNVHLDIAYPHHLAMRVATLSLLAAAFYVTAWLVAGESAVNLALRSYVLLAAGALLAALAWLELAPSWVALAWLGLALALCTPGRRLRCADLCWHEHALALGIVVRLVAVNMQSTQSLECYLPVLTAAASFYAVSRRCIVEVAAHKAAAAWAHTWLATGLLAALAWYKADEPWLAVVWALFALALAAFDRLVPLEELPLQAHVLALFAIGRTLVSNLTLTQSWHGYSLQLITVGTVAVVLYALTYVIRMREQERVRGLQHVYSFVATGLVAWLLWRQLLPMAVADGFAGYALLLFVVGEWRREKALQLQGYLVLAGAFLRIGVANLSLTALPWHGISARTLGILPVTLIALGIWARLQQHRDAGGWVADTLAWLSTASIAALLYTELRMEWVVVAWSAMAVVLLLAAWLLRKELFLRQAAAMLVVTVMQGVAANILSSSPETATFWQDNLHTLVVACVLLILSLPVGLKLRERYAEVQFASTLDRALRLDRIEQWIFFAPAFLSAFGIAMRMQPGIITLAWAVEGLAAVLLGLALAQRSFRLTGLLLLLLCVAKIVFRDAWHLSERDRYITFIALGGALMLVSMLYNRYRESVLKLL